MSADCYLSEVLFFSFLLQSALKVYTLIYLFPIIITIIITAVLVVAVILIIINSAGKRTFSASS